ncbi:MAG TPA: antitoxin Xre-like helix-turn-helix domain-containing protein [Steroidobacteraceae bacterium]|jgi:transcriptional regulator with XRE-family HTH domain|nr:antitoxin Xre-like helix-turn-helix domain-containing protein [Steroidobacteraceae bacterium]
MARVIPHPRPQTDPGRVLTGAVLRAAALLELTQARVAEILGLSPATVSRMAKGTYALDADKKEWEMAALFVRLFRSLDSLVGSNDESARAWLNGDNRALGDRPANLIRSAEGLVRAVHYLDAARSRI